MDYLSVAGPFSIRLVVPHKSDDAAGYMYHDGAWLGHLFRCLEDDSQGVEQNTVTETKSQTQSTFRIKIIEPCSRISIANRKPKIQNPDD